MVNVQVERLIRNTPHEEFFICVATQNPKHYASVVWFCETVLNEGKTPVFITNVSPMHKPMSLALRNCLDMSDKVRVYEAAKVGTKRTLQKRALLFQQINGGVIVWTP